MNLTTWVGYCMFVLRWQKKIDPVKDLVSVTTPINFERFAIFRCLLHP